MINHVNELIARLQKYNPHLTISTKDVAEALGYGNTQVWDATKAPQPNKRINRAAELALALLDANGSDSLNCYMSRFDVATSQSMVDYIERKLDREIEKTSEEEQIDLVDAVNDKHSELILFALECLSDKPALKFLDNDMLSELAGKLVTTIEEIESEVLLQRVSRLTSLIAGRGKEAGKLLNLRVLRQFVSDHPAQAESESLCENLSESESTPKAYYGFVSPLSQAMLRSDIESDHIDAPYESLISILKEMFGDRESYEFAQVRAGLVSLESPDLVQKVEPNVSALDLPDWFVNQVDVSSLGKRKREKIIKMIKRNPLAAQKILEVANDRQC
ncbi:MULTISPECIES: hypothetical protein [Vibrio]|uniref:Uncharacterized protein n=2 Tax=Vibrio TaxID=662 RepID=A0A5P9CRE5_9VIBR|nr:MULTISPECIES: hypothetical protein [Vibrio]MYM61657.1 hypothetical protein [Vibrio tetraodonis subsp. pristinus]QFT28829.1 hypothetical protein FIV01_20720 [Vibrio aquimaris]